MDSELSEQPPPDYEAEKQNHAASIKQVTGGNWRMRITSVFAAVFHDEFFRCLTGVSIGCWMIHEFVFDLHKIFLFGGIIFTFADVFYVFAHKVLPRRRWLVAICWLIYLACMAAVFHFKNEPESIDETKPTISQNMIQLGDESHALQTGVTIFNPSEFPIYSVAIQIGISGAGVKADSLNIITPLHESDYHEYPDDPTFYIGFFTRRFDYMDVATNQSVLFTIGYIPARSHYSFNIAGTVAANSFARIELKNYSTNCPHIFRTSTNFSWTYPIEMWHFHGPALVVSNSIFFTNVVPLQPEQIGKWIHYRVENY